MPPKPDATKQTQTEVLTEKAAVIAGAVAGCLAPLTTVAVAAFNKKSNLDFSDIPWELMCVFALIGAVVVFFLAERNRRHVFTYAIAAPFMVLGIIKTHDANVAETENKEKKKEIDEQAADMRAQEKVLIPAYMDALRQAEQAVANAEKDILNRPGTSLSYPPEQESTVDFENPSL